jgi:hypothetical protein
MVGIFLDFSKAFDTVNHSILLSKLDKYGIRGPANKWVDSYLKNRQQYCYVNNHNSTKSTISCGVPQGFILGPLLFLVYINDLANFSTIMSAILFADDSNLFISGSDLLTLEAQINTEIPKLVEWLKANRLSLNIKKTHLMIFGLKKHSPVKNINVFISNQKLDTVEISKFLGVIIDNKLSWKEHCLYTSKKLSKSIAILSLAKKYLNPKTMLQLYYSFIFPYLLYCNLAWGKAADSTLWPIYRNQKIALRIISGTPRRNSTIPYCKLHQIFRLPSIHKNSIGIFMFKSQNGLFPDIFNDFFTKNNELHTYHTRNAANLRAPTIKTQIGSKFIRNTGVSFWNNLENSITSNLKIGSYKKVLKSKIINSQI